MDFYMAQDLRSYSNPLKDSDRLRVRLLTDPARPSAVSHLSKAVQLGSRVKIGELYLQILRL